MGEIANPRSPIIAEYQSYRHLIWLSCLVIWKMYALENLTYIDVSSPCPSSNSSNRSQACQMHNLTFMKISKNLQSEINEIYTSYSFGIFL